MRKLDVRIVLIKSIYERNIGSTSRAMANMGFKNLILLAPQCEITFDAQQAAATGQYALQNRVVYKTWAEFFKNEPQGLMIATTARDGRGRQAQDLQTTLNYFLETNADVKKESDQPFVVHIIFGPEDAGLSAEDISHANFCCSIPTFGDNTSLNLAQATLLAMFITRSVFGGEKTQLEGQQKPKALQKKGEGIFPDESLRTWLTEMGFALDKKKINVYTTLKRMLLQNTPSAKEFRVLEIVLQQSIRKLRAFNDLKKD
ncbi:MAG: RNA methyltransferase [Bdellovibrionota bacterium]